MEKKLTYPIVLIHGTGFRDRKHFNYWGRIPKVLAAAGTEIFYGDQDSWGSISGNAEVLKVSINGILSNNSYE